VRSWGGKACPALFLTDFISLSAWMTKNPSLGVTMTSAINYIESYSGLPPGRIFIGEYGEAEVNAGDQYWDLYYAFDEAYSQGVLLGFAWMYKQGWPGDNLGIWNRYFQGPTAIYTDLTSGYDALIQLESYW